MPESATLEEFAIAAAERLSRRLAYQVIRAGRLGDAASIHDLRVAIRRLAQCLRLFEPILPARTCRKARRQMRKVIKRAGRVRNLDIALELMREARAPDPVLRAGLLDDRKAALQELREELRGFRMRRWR